jgi:hypothetical protein
MCSLGVQESQKERKHCRRPGGGLPPRRSNRAPSQRTGCMCETGRTATLPACADAGLSRRNLENGILQRALLANLSPDFLSGDLSTAGMFSASVWRHLSVPARQAPEIRDPSGWQIEISTSEIIYTHTHAHPLTFYTFISNFIQTTRLTTR